MVNASTRFTDGGELGFGDQAGAFLQAYAATTDAGAKRAAADYGGDRFIGYGTWKWIDLHRQTSGAPVWRYKFEQTLPRVRPDAPKDGELYAPHASEIDSSRKISSQLVQVVGFSNGCAELAL